MITDRADFRRLVLLACKPLLTLLALGMLYGQTDTTPTSPKVWHIVVLHPTTLFERHATLVDIGIRDAFRRNPERSELFLESLHLPQETALLDDLARNLKLRYATQHVDILLCESVVVYGFLQQHPDLWPDVPRVYFAVDAVSHADLSERGFGPNSTVGTIRLEIPRTIDLAFQLQPNAPEVVLVAGVHEEDQVLVRDAQKHMSEHYPGRRLRSLDKLPYTEQLAELKKLPPDVIVVMLTIYRDSTGRAVDSSAISREVAQATSAPAYYHVAPGLADGFVGGVVLDWGEIGNQAAQLAARVLRGEPAGSIPLPPPIRGKPMVNWQQMERWGIPEGRIPPGTEVLFREPTLWHDYRWQVIGAVALVLLQGLLIAAMLVQRARRRRAEAEVRESEARFRTMADSAPVMIWLSDHQQRFEWVNQRWLDFTGAKQESMLGEGWADVIHPEDLPKVRGSETRTGPLEFRARRHDGEYRWLLSTATPRGGPNVPNKGFIGSCLDITERKEAEVAEQKSRAEIAHLSRLSLMGELLASLSHELNQPLTGIRTNAEVMQILLKRENPDLEKVGECLTDIVRDDHRASEIIIRLRGLAKRQAPALVELDLATVVQEVVALVHSDALMHQVSLSIESERNLPRIQGDRIALQQVMLNLVMNAMAAVQECPVDRRRVCVSVASAGESLRVDVRDWGSGITQEKLRRLFEAFFTTKPDGLGMGLPICKNIIDSHHGRLWAENNPDFGATFHFTLPTV
jgi:PAS domain S-box-containing protein